ncbi:DUF1427 family protein [Sphingomonas sp. PB2P19]|uniref:DUF1427 family protein n=1 Tax=Sphingomonas rhamnosi TaxID=3096156 RepID=UPI002FC731B3
MRPYLISLAAGLFVGVIYALLKVRSPAPPTIALIGLAGILLGEQAVPLAKSLWASRDKAAAIRGVYRPCLRDAARPPPRRRGVIAP